MPWQKNIITDSSNGCQMCMVRVGPFKIWFQPFGTKCSRVASIASQSPRKRHLDNLHWTISIQLWHLQIHYRTLTGHDAITIYAWLHIFKYLNLHTLNLSWIWFNQRPQWRCRANTFLPSCWCALTFEANKQMSKCFLKKQQNQVLGPWLMDVWCPIKQKHIVLPSMGIQDNYTTSQV